MSTTTNQVATPQPQQPQQPASLYVGDLDPEVNDRVLIEFFSAQAPGLISGRVCRNSITKKSLGYGYVNFSTFKEAEAALELLNTSKLNDKPIRLMWSNRDPALRRSGVGNVFIKNLDPTIDHKELYDAFSQFGTILSCKIQLDENGNSRGFGFVHFESSEAADLAIAKVNQILIRSQKVFVGRFIPKRERQRAAENTWTNVYIKPLPSDITDEKLTEMFSKYGQITSVYIRSPATTADDVASFTPTKFGFVNFANNADARAAVEAMDGKVEGDVTYMCCRALKKSEREAAKQQERDRRLHERHTQSQGCNLYVKHLEEFVDEAKLKEVFGTFGAITSCKLLRDERGVSKGVAYVCYAKATDANAAINELHNHVLPSGTKPLFVNFHEPKQIRRQKMANLQIRGKYSQPGPRNQYPYQQGTNPYSGRQQQGRPFNPGMQQQGGRRMGGPQQRGQGQHQHSQQQQQPSSGDKLFLLARDTLAANGADTHLTGILLGALLKKASPEQHLADTDAFSKLLLNALDKYTKRVVQQGHN